MAKSTTEKKQTKTAKKTTEKKSKGSNSGGIVGSIEALQKKLKPKLKGSPWLETTVMEYFEVLKKFNVLEGRSRRREFWMFCLCNFIIGVVLGMLGLFPIIGFLFGIVSFVFSLAVFIPSFTVGIRRLHDTNRSGWSLLFMLIPLAGPIIVIVFWVLAGTSGSNKYGTDPKR